MAKLTRVHKIALTNLERYGYEGVAIAAPTAKTPVLLALLERGQMVKFYTKSGFTRYRITDLGRAALQDGQAE